MELTQQLFAGRTPTTSTRLVEAFGSPSVVLFLALFASQAGVLVLSPILGDVARDFDVSISAAGQLRILAVPLSAVVALSAAKWLGRYDPRSVLALGVLLLASGSLASAAAPSFAALALAQVPVWAGVAILLAAGISAVARWAAPEARARVVARALAGPPAAWIVGMPLIGLAGEVSWRLAFVVLPVPAAILAGLALAARPRTSASTTPSATSLSALLRTPSARRWAVGEFLVSSAWAGTLVFSGALFTEVHGTSSRGAGLGLALVAIAYLLGNIWGGRLDAARARRSMLEATVASAVAIGLVWAVTPDVMTTLVLFSVAAFVTAARNVSGTVYGFAVSHEHQAGVGTIRATTGQLGYLVGSLAGGVALSVGGFDALALAFGGLFLTALVPYLCVKRACRHPAALAST